MGQIQRIVYEKLIEPEPDRNSNLLRVYHAPNSEVVIHFRNLKIVLHNDEEIAMWKNGFAEALKKLRDKRYFENDI